jgi:hypothetical protein
MQLFGPGLSTEIGRGCSGEAVAARLVWTRFARTRIETRLDWFMAFLLCVDRSGLDTKSVDLSAGFRIAHMDEAR